MARKKGSQPAGVFLSHSNRNRRFASKLAGDLHRHGLPVWYSKTNMLGAQQRRDEIGQALERCDWFALIPPPSAARSKWVKHELFCALNDNRYEGHSVPVMHHDCDCKKLSWTLHAFQMIDFTRNHDVNVRELLRVWGLGYQP